MIKRLKSAKILVPLLCIVFVASFLRLFMLGNNSFVADEFLDINATYGHNQTGVWQAWDFNKDAVSTRINPLSDARAWLYRIQVSGLFDISFFPPEEWSARLVSVLWGILTTVIIFGVTYAWTRNPWIALIASFLWAVSVPAIEMNRKLRMYSMFAPVFLLFSWTLFQFIESAKQKTRGVFESLFALNYYYLLPVLALGYLSFHLHPLTANIVFVLFVYFFALSARKMWPLEAFSRYGIYATLLLLFCGAVYASVPSVQENFSSLLTITTHISYLGHITESFWHPLIGILLIAFGISYAFLRGKDRKGEKWIAIHFVVILLMAMFFWNRNVGAQYIFFIQPFAMILAAMGAYDFWMFVRPQKVTRQFLMLCLSLFVLLVPHYGYFLQENTTYNITSSGETPHYRKIFDYVGEKKRLDDVLVTRNFRNYYYAGHDFQVYDFGSERSADVLAAEGKVPKITYEILENIYTSHPHGWFVYADNDEKFISKEAQQFARENFIKVRDSSLVRGKIFVYYWGELPEKDIADQAL